GRGVGPAAGGRRPRAGAGRPDGGEGPGLGRGRRRVFCSVRAPWRPRRARKPRQKPGKKKTLRFPLPVSRFGGVFYIGGDRRIGDRRARLAQFRRRLVLRSKTKARRG